MYKSLQRSMLPAHKVSLAGMLHSQSAVEVLQQKNPETPMNKSFSIPSNMHSEIDARRWQSLNMHQTTMEGHVIIKNSRSSKKELLVLSSAKNGMLYMFFEQMQGGIWHKFQLVNLRIENLVLMYSIRDPTSFYIATPWQNRLDISIYCTPSCQSMNAWLLALQQMGARVLYFQDKICVLQPVPEIECEKKNVLDAAVRNQP